MLNFKALYEFLFKSFVVGRDVEMIERLLEDGYQSVLIIKRSWLYGLASSLWLFPLLGLGFANIYLILRHFEFSGFWMTVAGFIGLNIIWTIYSSARYILDFRKTYGESVRVMHAKDLIGKLIHADESFVQCFNQLQTNFLIFLIVIAVYLIHIFFVAERFEFAFAALDAICIMFQLFLIRRFVHLIIDLEMDFNLVVKWRMVFIDQRWVYANIDTIDSDKIKNIRSSYPNFLASFFHFGTIEVLTEWDEQLLGHNAIEYVPKPEEAVSRINSLLSGKIEIEETVHNHYLQKVLEQFPELSPEDRKSAIKKYLRDYEQQIKKEYQESQDPELRKEIEEVYRDYYA